MVCFERTENDEPIWSCRICFQIFHLKCITVWYLKSYNGTVWKCPACQCEVNEKPNYSCFWGNLTNPFSNNVDTPHTCGQICGIRKTNSNKMYDCHHKCTLICHPGPCPWCVVQVQRTCGCGKTKVHTSTRYSTSAVSDDDMSVNNSDESETQDICVATSIEETDSDPNGVMDSDDEDGELEERGFRYSLNNSCSCSHNSNSSDEENYVYRSGSELSYNCFSPNSQENTNSICSYVNSRNSDSPPFLSDSEPYQTE